MFRSFGKDRADREESCAVQGESLYVRGVTQVAGCPNSDIDGRSIVKTISRVRKRLGWDQASTKVDSRLSSLTLPLATEISYGIPDITFLSPSKQILIQRLFQTIFNQQWKVRQDLLYVVLGRLPDWTSLIAIDSHLFFLASRYSYDYLLWVDRARFTLVHNLDMNEFGLNEPNFPFPINGNSRYAYSLSNRNRKATSSARIFFTGLD